MATFSGNLNPNLIKTRLDEVFMQEFQFENKPGLATTATSDIFKQNTIDRGAVIMETFKGVGYWDERAEEEDVASGTPRSTNLITFSVLNFAKSVDISKNLFDDDIHNTYEMMVRDMAETGKLTREKKGFEIYRNAFTSTYTADSATLISDTHTTISGVTVDNKLTAALSTTSLNTAIVALMEQKAEDGTIRGCIPNALLVPVALFKTACEIVESVLLADTANNNMNVYSSKYGIRVYQSPFLGAAAGGSDTAWFLLSSNHSVNRWVRQAITTDLVSYEYQRNNNYIYKAEFREVFGAINYIGIVGSTGAA